MVIVLWEINAALAFTRFLSFFHVLLEKRLIM